jgi:hypothetical protein
MKISIFLSFNAVEPDIVPAASNEPQTNKQKQSCASWILFSVCPKFTGTLLALLL